MTPKAAAGALQVLAFRLGEERYALGLEAVEEVADGAGMRRRGELPGALCGEIDLRGVAVPVVDLRRRLGLEDRAAGERVLIVRAEGAGEVGVLVGEVHGVLGVPADSIAPAPRYFERSREVLRGIARLEDGLTIVLDPARLLSAEDREALRRWEERGSGEAAPS